MAVMAEIADDRLLVERFNRGDEAAFDRIIEQHSADVAVLANRLLGWPGDVEDITQDIFLAALVGLKEFRCKCSLKTWLFTITVNKCRTYRYRSMLRLRLVHYARSRVLCPTARLADQAATDSDTFSRVRNAVRALPRKYREPVVLRYLQELPTDQIMTMLGISENALQVRLHRARNLLKQNLAELIED